LARGWESKGVESQQDEAAAAREARKGPPPTPEALERRARIEGIRLSRARTLTALQGACHPGHRALLEETLAHLDRELAELDPG
jgi:hypothetical protein